MLDHGPGVAVRCRTMIISNSAGRTAANPTTMLTIPCVTSSWVVVVASPCTTKSWAGEMPWKAPCMNSPCRPPRPRSGFCPESLTIPLEHHPLQAVHEALRDRQRRSPMRGVCHRDLGHREHIGACRHQGHGRGKGAAHEHRRVPQADFSRNGETYDLIVDTVGTAALSHCSRSLKDGGRLLMVLIEFPDMIRGAWVSLTIRQTIIAEPGAVKLEDLHHLAALAEADGFQPVIDRRLGERLGTSSSRYVTTLRQAWQSVWLSFHNIGKFMVPAELLHTPTTLTHHGDDLIKEPAVAGYNILKNVVFYSTRSGRSVAVAP